MPGWPGSISAFRRVRGLHLVSIRELPETAETLAALPDEDFSQTFVLVRVYELDDGERELVHAITYATNSQNPVELNDLRANDEVQRTLELGLRELGYTYARRRREDGDKGAGDDGRPVIKPARAAEAVLAVWRRMPHLARFQRHKHFGLLYETIFDDSLTPAEVVVAVRLLERVSQRIDEAAPDDDAPRFLPYAVHFLAMLTGDELRTRLGGVETVTHRELGEALRLLDEAFDDLYARALLTVQVLLGVDGIDERKASLQRLSATFRRGDLVHALDGLEGKAISFTRALASDMKSHIQELRQRVKREIDNFDSIKDIEDRRKREEYVKGMQDAMDHIEFERKSILLSTSDELPLSPWLERTVPLLKQITKLYGLTSQQLLQGEPDE